MATPLLAGHAQPHVGHPIHPLGDPEKAWDTFGADPEWQKVREESIACGEQIVDYQNLSIWRAALFSLIQ